MLELQGTLVNDAIAGIEGPDRASKNLGCHCECTRRRNHLQMNVRSRAQGPLCVHKRSSRTQIDESDDAAGSKRGAGGSDKCRSRVDATFGQRLIHLRPPVSYFRTRVRPVTPRMRTAYCARRPRT